MTLRLRRDVITSAAAYAATRRDILPFALYILCECVFQPDNSNQSQVTLRKVDFGLSGTFSCEVTADAPTFSTASGTKNLTVVCKYMLHVIIRYHETPHMHEADCQSSLYPKL